MVRRNCQVYMGSELFGTVEIVANAIRWMATPMSQSAKQVVDLLPDEAFEAIADGKPEYDAYGFTLVAS